MAEVSGFNQLLLSMAEADFFTGILPFLLTYILSFLAVQRVPLVQGEDAADQKKFSAIISIIIAFLVSNFLIQNPVYQGFFVQYLGRVTVGMVGILGLLLLFGMAGWQIEKVKQPLFGLIAVLFAIFAFGFSGGLYAFIPQTRVPVIGATLREMFAYTMESGLIWLIVIAIALYWVTKTPSNGDDKFAPWVLPWRNHGGPGGEPDG